MYWNNDILEFRWPCDQDPVIQSLHNGKHCLFYNPAVSIEHIQPQQTLQNLCDLANELLAQRSVQGFFDLPDYYDWITNLVKINLMVPTLKQYGCVKPMLLIYQHQLPYTPATGDSRLKALTCVPEISTVPAFVTAHADCAHELQHLIPVTTFDQFAEYCQVSPGTRFVFRFTDDQAPYGLDWYEFDHEVSVPSNTWCLQVLQNYLDQQPESFRFTTDWFAVEKSWL